MFMTYRQEWDPVQMKNFEVLCKIDEGVGYIMLSAVTSLQNSGKSLIFCILYMEHWKFSPLQFLTLNGLTTTILLTEPGESVRPVGSLSQLLNPPLEKSQWSMLDATKLKAD